MARRVHWYAGRAWPDPRNTRAWRALVVQVVREEPLCWLRLDGCTTASETADHVLPVSVRPDLGMERSNLRGACRACNDLRRDKPVGTLTGLRRPAQRPPALSFFD